MRKLKNQKLSPEFFGPFSVEAKVGTIAYKLALLVGARIHHTFHVSQLKKHIRKAPSSLTLPLIGTDGALLKEPVRILDRGMVKKGNHAATEVLVEWGNTFAGDSTWENLQEHQWKFPDFDP